MDGQDQDITSGRFATDQSATREEQSLAVSLQDALATTMLHIPVLKVFERRLLLWSPKLM